MDFGLIALIALVVSKVLDYVAPKTKNKVDDAIRDAVYKVIPLLPAAKEARAPATETLEGSTPAPEPPKTLSGFRIRDHRKN